MNYEIIGEILENGEFDKGPTDQGYVYKDPNAFESKSSEVCYIPELCDEKYTFADILDICKGNEEIARIVFEVIDWQSPETYYEELINDGEVFECKCGKNYLSYEVDNCPHCGAKKEY